MNIQISALLQRYIKFCKYKLLNIKYIKRYEKMMISENKYIWKPSN